MTKTLSITKARDELPTLVDRAYRMLDEYTITVNGSPAAVLVSASEFESWKETMEILADPALLKAIKSGEDAVRSKRTYKWDQVKKDLGINV